MGEIAQKHQDQLERIKKNVSKFYDYFKENYSRWYAFKKFLYVTALTTQDLSVLRDIGKPEIEFNILEAYVSRQKGEFSKQIPSIHVMKGENGDVDANTIETVDGHMQYAQCDFKKKYANEIYDDMLSGGFSVAKVYTDYSDEMSFEQLIKAKRVFDPTLCGFDPICEESHKGDGSYCFEITPYREEEFKELEPNINTSEFKFSTDLGKFNWSYRNNNDKIILVCTYFEKKKKRAKIVKLSNKQVMTGESYDDYLVKHELSGSIEQPAQIIGERTTYLTEIVRYRFIENKVLDHKLTDYKYLPLVFFDGNSVEIRETIQSELKQITRPYCYQAKGVQQLKNLAGQTLANEIENMVQHKFMIPLEGIPEQYLDAYTDVQTPKTMIYHQFYNNNPDVRLDPPAAVPRQPTPPEITATFQGSDQTTQAILGSYDAALGINQNQLSGVAIQEGATQSNATGMPYINGFLAGLNQIAKIYLDLIPKYYVTPRSIPIIDKKGKRAYTMVNGGNGQPSLKYDANALNAEVKAGINFTMQKSKNLQQLSMLMKTSPMMAQFFGGTEEGLKFILDNLDVSNLEQLKEAVDKFIPRFQKMQQSQPNPQMIKAQTEQQKMQRQEMQDQRKNQIDLANVSVQDKDADTRRLATLAKIGHAETDQEMKQNAVDAENARTQVDLAIKAADMSHRHNKEAIEVADKITK
jgi:hypothetical protein